MRGKVSFTLAADVCRRITPAYAGKSANSEPITLDVEDHPRLCGEKPDITHAIMTSTGSPPPMRGKVIVAFEMYKNHRITPAYAGKSDMDSPDFSRSKDHPRLCGEKFAKKVYKKKSTRITPAYAGKSLRWSIPPAVRMDHPRLCGEKRNGVYNINTGKGSPPPMRGKDTCDEVTKHVIGITPAYAGKSSFLRSRLFLIRDHPRLCGEKTNSQTADVRSLGSPPPMRGKESTGNSERRLKRITPAYAGKRTNYAR